MILYASKVLIIDHFTTNIKRNICRITIKNFVRDTVAVKIIRSDYFGFELCVLQILPEYTFWEFFIKFLIILVPVSHF